MIPDYTRKPMLPEMLLVSKQCDETYSPLWLPPGRAEQFVQVPQQRPVTLPALSKGLTSAPRMC